MKGEQIGCFVVIKDGGGGGGGSRAGAEGDGPGFVGAGMYAGGHTPSHSQQIHFRPQRVCVLVFTRGSSLDSRCVCVCVCVRVCVCVCMHRAYMSIHGHSSMFVMSQMFFSAPPFSATSSCSAETCNYCSHLHACTNTNNNMHADASEPKIEQELPPPVSISAASAS